MSRTWGALLTAAAIVGAAEWTCAAEPAPDLGTETTAGFLALCQNDADQCHRFIDSVMRFLDAAAGFNEVQSYQVCAQLPLNQRDETAILAWIRTHPERAAPIAADAIGAAGEILWPCR